MKNLFGRIDVNNNVAVFRESGEIATRLDANVYPIGSSLSAKYEHPEGIKLTQDDARKLGIEIID